MLTKVRLVEAQSIVTSIGSSQLPTVVKIQEALITTVSSGITGQRGPSGGETLQKYSLVAISGHKVVISSGNDEISYASNNVLDHQFRVVGITLNSASIGFPIEVRQFGEITEPSWSFSVGPVFLGVNGELTQVPPVSPAVFSLIMGYALSPTTINVNIQSPINIG